MNLIFASNNKGKIKEVQALLPEFFTIQTLEEAGITEDIDEPFFTFNENAFAKANYIQQRTGQNCISEDSGLVVEALNGAPGVFSARYAGEPKNDAANNQKLLQQLGSNTNRNAYYQSVICLILDGSPYYFDGKCTGNIAYNISGNGGFGYDPLFIPDGYQESFGILPVAVKHSISHRAEAMQKLVDFLKTKIA